MIGLRALLFLLLGLGALLPGCGYRLAGKIALPESIQVIAVLPFENRTTRPEIEQRVTEEVASELNKRGRIRVGTDASKADAILEGAITSVQSIAMLNETSLSMELARQAIGEQIAADGAQHPTIQQIIDAITRFYDVKLTDLLSKRRQKSIALPRQIGMWLARKYTRYSLEEIGGYFGGRDHTTVMHAIRAVNTKRENDTTIDHDVSRLEQMLVKRFPAVDPVGAA